MQGGVNDLVTNDVVRNSFGEKKMKGLANASGQGNYSKFVGTKGLNFLLISLPTDSPQEGGAVPSAKTLLKSVAKM